jgi:hypothetical protein
VFATIILPPNLSFADATESSTKHLQYPQLFPQQSSSVQWMVKHPPTTVEKRYVIKVWVHAANADSSLCEAEVIIPPLDSPILAPRCSVPDSLYFDDAADSYFPNPFTIRLTCVNNGNTPVEDVTGTVILPRYVEFDPPDQPATKQFYPLEMKKWNLSDPVPEVTWTVRWVPRLRSEMYPEFRFTVTGKSFAGTQLDSTEVRRQTRIPGLQPYFAGCMRIPDSLGLRADGLDVTPNPFTVRYPLRNISHIRGALSRVHLSFPPDGLSLQPASPWPIDSGFTAVVEPGDSAVFEWLIDVSKRNTRRNVLIQGTVFDDEGNPFHCEDWLPIANIAENSVLWRLHGSCTTSDARLNFDKPHATYVPDTFLITGIAWNAGSLDIHDITTRINWVNPLDEQRNELDLVELDPQVPENEGFRSHDLLHPGDSVRYVWKFRLKDWNRTWSMKYVRFNLEVCAKELSATAIGNEARVEIAPSKILTSVTIPTPGVCTLHPAHPNPFRTSTTVSFSLAKASPVTLVITDVLGREVRQLLNQELRSSGMQSIRFEPGELRPGVYFARLSVGATVVTGKMLLH